MIFYLYFIPFILFASFFILNLKYVDKDDIKEKARLYGNKLRKIIKLKKDIKQFNILLNIVNSFFDGICNNKPNKLLIYYKNNENIEFNRNISKPDNIENHENLSINKVAQNTQNLVLTEKIEINDYPVNNGIIEDITNTSSDKIKDISNTMVTENIFNNNQIISEKIENTQYIEKMENAESDEINKNNLNITKNEKKNKTKNNIFKKQKEIEKSDININKILNNKNNLEELDEEFIKDNIYKLTTEVNTLINLESALNNLTETDISISQTNQNFHTPFIITQNNTEKIRSSTINKKNQSKIFIKPKKEKNIDTEDNRFIETKFTDLENIDTLSKDKTKKSKKVSKKETTIKETTTQIEKEGNKIKIKIKKNN